MVNNDYKLQEVLLATWHGGRRKVMAWVLGGVGLCYHRETQVKVFWPLHRPIAPGQVLLHHQTGEQLVPSPLNGEWLVSHVSSGMLIQSFSSEAGAKCFIGLLTGMADWTASPATLRQIIAHDPHRYPGQLPPRLLTAYRITLKYQEEEKAKAALVKEKSNKSNKPRSGSGPGSGGGESKAALTTTTARAGVGGDESGAGPLRPAQLRLVLDF
jgi:hypothetical protein